MTLSVSGSSGAHANTQADDVTHQATASASGSQQAAQPTQRQITRDALHQYRTAPAEASGTRRGHRAAVPGPRAETAPVTVQPELPGAPIVVTMRPGHWVKKHKLQPAGERAGLNTGKLAPPIAHDAAKLTTPQVCTFEFDGQTVTARRSDPPEMLANLVVSLARAHRAAQAAKPNAATQNTDPRTEEGAAWLRGEFEKISSRVSNPAFKPRKEVVEWIISGDFPPIESREPGDVYWEHILLRYCGGDFLDLDLKRNYSTDLHWAYIGEWNATGRGMAAINTSATLLNDALATTQYDVFDTTFQWVGERLCVTEYWGYRDNEINHNQVTDGVDTFWIGTQITHKMISLTIDDADPNPNDYYDKIGLENPEMVELHKRSMEWGIDGDEDEIVASDTEDADTASEAGSDSSIAQITKRFTDLSIEKADEADDPGDAFRRSGFRGGADS